MRDIDSLPFPLLSLVSSTVVLKTAETPEVLCFRTAVSAFRSLGSLNDWSGYWGNVIAAFSVAVLFGSIAVHARNAARPGRRGREPAFFA